MKEEVAQHCVRLLDARDTLRGHYDRDYQLRAMGYFILVAKFHNRVQVKVTCHACVASETSVSLA